MWEYLARNLKADVNILVLFKLRKLVPSPNVACTGISSIRMAWSFSLKYLSVKPRLLMKKGWFLEVESRLGKSFKVSVYKFIRRRTHSHNLWLLLVYIVYRLPPIVYFIVYCLGFSTCQVLHVVKRWIGCCVIEWKFYFVKSCNCCCSLGQSDLPLRRKSYSSLSPNWPFLYLWRIMPSGRTWANIYCSSGYVTLA